MPRIKFATDFVWMPKPAVSIKYKAGHSYPVTQACAEAAASIGAASLFHANTVSPSNAPAAADLPQLASKSRREYSRGKQTGRRRK